MPVTSPVRRRFADLPLGQIHYRESGTPGDRPLLLLHGSPGSAAGLVPLIEALAPHRHVIAPDTPGFGDSSPHPIENPSISDFAAALIQFIELLGLENIDIYGFHTGACIAVETALHRPGLLHRIVLDGVGLYPGKERDRLLAHYAPRIEFDPHGAYLIKAFHFLRDQSLFWPWFDHRRQARRDGGIIPTRQLHGWLVELLKAAETYHLGYHAAFKWDAEKRLAHLGTPALIIAADDDPLANESMELAQRLQLPNHRLPRFDEASFQNQKATQILTFTAAR